MAVVEIREIKSGVSAPIDFWDLDHLLLLVRLQAQRSVLREELSHPEFIDLGGES